MRIIPHFPFPSMGNERSCCLTHFGRDSEMAFHFPDPALGYPCAIGTVSVSPGESGGDAGRQRRPHQRGSFQGLGQAWRGALVPWPLWVLRLRSNDNLQRKKRGLDVVACLGLSGTGSDQQSWKSQAAVPDPCLAPGSWGETSQMPIGAGSPSILVFPTPNPD